MYLEDNNKFRFYVYAYLRKDLTPYYIGKGTGYRIYKIHNKGFKPPKDRSRIIILENNLSEIGALSLERRMIRWYGRKDLGTGILHNKTDGGDGVSGFNHSKIAREKMSKARLGKSPWNKGKKYTINYSPSEETRIKISKRLSGKKRSSEQNKRNSESHKGQLPNRGCWKKGHIPWNKKLLMA